MAKSALTDAKVRSIKAAAEGTRKQYMDSIVPGFGVRVTDKGIKTYILQTRFPGSPNPARREIKKCDAIDLAAARETARGWLELIKRGIDPAQVEEKAKEEKAKVRANTFGGIMNDYFERKLAKQRSATAAVAQSAASLRATLTPDDVAITRAGDAADRIGRYMDSLRGTGVLREFNRAYKRRREAAGLRGEGFMTYKVAEQRLRQAVVPLLTSGGQLPIGQSPFETIFRS